MEDIKMIQEFFSKDEGEISKNINDLTFEDLMSAFKDKYNRVSNTRITADGEEEDVYGEHDAVTFPNTSDSRTGINSESDLESWKSKTSKRFGNVKVTFHPQSKQWFNLVSVDDEAFNDDKKTAGDTKAKHLDEDSDPNKNKQINIGDEVEVNRSYGGGTGIVTNKVGPFVVVNSKSYHESDVRLVYSLEDLEGLEGLDESTSENNKNEGDKIDIVTMDVPLFIRVLEYAREDAQEDMDLHDLAEKAIVATKQQGILAMDDYDMLVGDDSIEEANVTWSTLHKDNKDLDQTAKIYFLQQVRKGKIDQLPKDPKAEYMKLKLKGLVESSKNIVGDKQITKDQFSKLKGKGIVYNGSAWNVIDSNEYAIEIENNKDKKTINFTQFSKGGIAKRLARAIKESQKNK